MLAFVTTLDFDEAGDAKNAIIVDEEWALSIGRNTLIFFLLHEEAHFLNGDIDHPDNLKGFFRLWRAEVRADRAALDMYVRLGYGIQVLKEEYEKDMKDIVNQNRGFKGGVINGFRYAYIKAKINKLTKVSQSFSTMA